MPEKVWKIISDKGNQIKKGKHIWENWVIIRENPNKGIKMK